MEIEKTKSLIEQSQKDEKLQKLEEVKLRTQLSKFFAEDQNITVVNSEGAKTEYFVPRSSKSTAKLLANFYTDMLKYYDKYSASVTTEHDGKNRFYFKKNDDKKSEIPELNAISLGYLKSKQRYAASKALAQNINDKDIKEAKRMINIAKRQQSR